MTALGILSILGLLFLLGMAVVAALTVAAGLVAVGLWAAWRLVKALVDRSRRNARAAAMRRHPSAWRRPSPWLDLDELDRQIAAGAGMPQAEFRRLWLNEWAPRVPTREERRCELRPVYPHDEPLVESGLDDTVVLPASVDVTTYDDAEPVVLRLYPPTVPPRPVITNNAAPDGQPCG